MLLFIEFSLWFLKLDPNVPSGIFIFPGWPQEAAE